MLDNAARVRADGARVQSTCDFDEALVDEPCAEAKAKKDQIIARARTAKAATKVNDMLSGVGTGSSMAAVDRMTEKVDQLEATAEVSKQLAGSSSTGAGSTVDDRFKALESGSSVDDELKAMKGALPSAVDDELAEMKKLLADDKSD